MLCQRYPDTVLTDASFLKGQGHQGTEEIVNFFWVISIQGHPGNRLREVSSGKWLGIAMVSLRCTKPKAKKRNRFPEPLTTLWYLINSNKPIAKLSLCNSLVQTTTELLLAFRRRRKKCPRQNSQATIPENQFLTIQNHCS